MSLAAIGLSVAMVAALLHPGLTTECGPQTSESTRLVRTPLRAVFLLDASSSVDSTAWESEKSATEAIIEAFKEVYQPDLNRLHIGLAQFASKLKLEQEISSDLARVITSVKSMAQLGGGTSFAGALAECQKQLTAYEAAGSETFDLCILITDGASQETKAELQNILMSSTKLMGIYVGNDVDDSKSLYDLTSCTGTTSPECPFFESAADFSLLRSRARDLASRVTSDLTSEETERVITYECDAPIWTLWGLSFWLPFLMWWCYLHCPRPSCPALMQKQARKEPVRLATAGRNEDRKI